MPAVVVHNKGALMRKSTASNRIRNGMNKVQQQKQMPEQNKISSTKKPFYKNPLFIGIAAVSTIFLIHKYHG